MKKKNLLILTPLLVSLFGCSSGRYDINLSCNEGGSLKAYQNGSLLGEADSSKKTQLNTLSIGDSFTLQVNLSEGYKVESVKNNEKLVTSSNAYYSITIDSLPTNIVVTFKQIESKSADFTYVYNDDMTATIVSYSSNELPTPLSLPSTTTHDNKTYKVTGIAKESFANLGVTKIKIPSSISKIEYGAFNSVYNLSYIDVDEANAYYKSVDGVLYNKDEKELIALPSQYDLGDSSTFKVPNSVTSFAPYSFYASRVLKHIEFGSSLESIGDYAFYNATSLLDLTLPTSLKSIGESAFYQNSNLKAIAFAEGLESIGDYAFYGLVYITSLSFPDSLKKIGGNAFYKCDKLKSVDFGEGIEEIGELAFSNEDNITSLSFPKSLKKIGNSAFSVCSSLTKVSFSEGLEEIGNSAFALCNNISAIALPASLKKIGSNPFYAILKLNSSNFSVSSESEYFDVVSGVLYTKDHKKLICYPYGLTSSSYEVLEGSEELAVQSFRLVASLSSITLPKSIKKLDECFYEMSSSASSPFTINYKGSEEEYKKIDKEGSNDESYLENTYYYKINYNA